MGIKEMNKIMEKYPEKFVSIERAFNHIQRGNRIFVGTGCGRPQYLLQSLIRFIESHPTAFLDAEVFHVWTLGLEPYTDEKFKKH
jgi:acyl-CoA hydrolase